MIIDNIIMSHDYHDYHDYHVTVDSPRKVNGDLSHGFRGEPCSNQMQLCKVASHHATAIVVLRWVHRMLEEGRREEIPTDQQSHKYALLVAQYENREDLTTATGSLYKTS